MNLNKLPDWKKTQLFVVAGKEDFFQHGMTRKDKEVREYKKLGLPPPIYSMYGEYIPGKLYSLDPMADRLDEMLARIIVW